MASTAVGLAASILAGCLPLSLGSLPPLDLPGIRIASGSVRNARQPESSEPAESSRSASSSSSAALSPTPEASPPAGSLRSGASPPPAEALLAASAPEDSGTPRPEVFAPAPSTEPWSPGLFAPGTDPAGVGTLARQDSRFVGSILAPPGIVAKNSSKYWIAAFEQFPFAGGLVVLMSPDGFYYLDKGGRPVTATTDAQGRYDFGDFRIPAGQNVLVSASFPGDRILYQYAYSAAGDNHVDVDAAGTYVSAYLIAQSRRLGRPLESFETASLGRLHDLTRAMLDAGTLSFDPDLFTMPRAGDLVAAYQAAFRASSPDLAAAWSNVLGQ